MPKGLEPRNLWIRLPATQPLRYVHSLCGRHFGIRGAPGGTVDGGVSGMGADVVEFAAKMLVMVSVFST